jgi:hypothetical protein
LSPFPYAPFHDMNKWRQNSPSINFSKTVVNVMHTHEVNVFYTHGTIIVRVAVVIKIQRHMCGLELAIL